MKFSMLSQPPIATPLRRTTSPCRFRNRRPSVRRSASLLVLISSIPSLAPPRRRVRLLLDRVRRESPLEESLQEQVHQDRRDGSDHGAGEDLGLIVAELADEELRQQGHRLLVGVLDEDQRQYVVVPRRQQREYHDRRCDRAGHRQDHVAEGLRHPCAVHPCASHGPGEGMLPDEGASEHLLSLLGEIRASMWPVRWLRSTEGHATRAWGGR